MVPDHPAHLLVSLFIPVMLVLGLGLKGKILVLGLGLVAQVLGLGLGLGIQVLGLGLESGPWPWPWPRLRSVGRGQMLLIMLYTPASITYGTLQHCDVTYLLIDGFWTSLSIVNNSKNISIYS